MAITELAVNISKDETLVIYKKDKTKYIVPFQPIGERNVKKPYSMNGLDIVCEFNKGELFLLKIVKDGMDQNHIVKIKKSDYSPTDQRKITQAIKSFMKKELIHRTKREHYFVNPWFLAPRSAEDQQKITTAWLELN